MDIKNNLAANLKLLREKRKITQYKMAAYLGISRSAYSLYEMGRRTPPLEVLTSISDKLQVSINDLIGYTDKLSLPGSKRFRQKPKDIPKAKAVLDVCELLDYAGLDIALTSDEIQRITKITCALHKALIADIKDNTTDIIV